MEIATTITFHDIFDQDIQKCTGISSWYIHGFGVSFHHFAEDCGFKCDELAIENTFHVASVYPWGPKHSLAEPGAAVNTMAFTSKEIVCCSSLNKIHVRCMLTCVKDHVFKRDMHVLKPRATYLLQNRSLYLKILEELVLHYCRLKQLGL